MRHLDLFSGIGGFALAAKEIWGDEYECIGFCDHDWFCQQVLSKNFPYIPIYGDIRTITNAAGERLERGNGSDETFTKHSGCVDLITGGFPCQPFSAAGRRKGTEDDRYLWPEMFRVIREFKPAWVIGENVYGLTTWSNGMVLEQVCTDLESEGYEVQPIIIPAVAVNAPHRRDRIWIVADTANSIVRRMGLERKPHKETAEPGGFSWKSDWREVAFATCLHRMDDGIPERLVRFPDGTETSEARWRKEALKAYGNAIVPQVAMEIMRAIKESSIN